MCIAICSVQGCEEYPFVLISNRDEFFIRPTRCAQLDEQSCVITPRDLARKEGGTWIGCNEANGSVCCLVNYREPSMSKLSPISRGKLPAIFLNESLQEFEHFFLNNSADIGGFTFMYGNMKKLDEVHIVSNRSRAVTVKKGSVVGMSNSKVDEPWPKVKRGEALLRDLLAGPSRAAPQEKEQLIADLFRILSDNTMEGDPSMEKLPTSIFIPPVKCEKKDDTFFGNYYGTRTQTVILMDKAGNTTYLEKTLYDQDNLDIKDSTQRFDFNIFAKEGHF